MNKTFVIAALIGVLNFDQVKATRFEDDSNLLELEDNDDFAPEDLQELEADVDSYAPPAKPATPAAKKAAAAAAKKAPAAKAAGAAKKADESSSEDESTSDDERHEAYKDGERNSSQN
jgi:hypothetical protein